MLITAPLKQFGYSLLFPLERNCHRNEGFVCLVNWVNRAVMHMLQGLHMRNDSNQDVTVHSAHKCSNGQSCCQAWEVWMFQNIILEMEIYQFSSKNYALQRRTELPWQPLPYLSHKFFRKWFTRIIKQLFFPLRLSSGQTNLKFIVKKVLYLQAYLNIALVFGWMPMCCCVVAMVFFAVAYQKSLLVS